MAGPRFHDRPVELQREADDQEELVFLRYLQRHAQEESGESPHLPQVCEALGLSAEEGRRRARELEEDGFLLRERARDPAGPELRLTAAGRRAATEQPDR